jgi:hypothetical protein
MQIGRDASTKIWRGNGTASGWASWITPSLVRGEFTISGAEQGAAHSVPCYKYYLTALGKQVVAAGLKLRELVTLRELAAASR